MRITRYLRATISALLLAATASGWAGQSCEDKGVVFGALSYHFWERSKNNYDETNETLGFYCGNWTVARINNSHREEAWLITKNVKTLSLGNHKTVFELGMAFGYYEVRGGKSYGEIGVYSFKFYKPITERLNTVLRLNHEVAILSFEYRL